MSKHLTSRSNWNLEMLVFMEGGKPEYPEKTLGTRTRTNNKLNPHMTPGPGIEPGPHWWKASALTTAPSLLPLSFLMSHGDTWYRKIPRCESLKIRKFFLGLFVTALGALKLCQTQYFHAHLFCKLDINKTRTCFKSSHFKNFFYVFSETILTR